MGYFHKSITETVKAKTDRHLINREIITNNNDQILKNYVLKLVSKYVEDFFQLRNRLKILALPKYRTLLHNRPGGWTSEYVLMNIKNRGICRFSQVFVC